MTEGKNVAAITFMFSVRSVSRFAIGINIHVANRISVSFRIEGISLVVFASLICFKALSSLIGSEVGISNAAT